MKSRTLLIAIGNEFRCDDAAALVAARRLRRRFADLEIVEHTGDAAALLDLWKDADTVILLDAVQSGAPPGTIHHFDIKENGGGSACPTGTHSLSILQAVDLARALGRLPHVLAVYGIEGEHFQYGTKLSKTVQQAIEKLISELLASSLLT